MINDIYSLGAPKDCFLQVFFRTSKSCSEFYNHSISFADLFQWILWNWFVQTVKTNYATKSTSLEFAYHLPKPWTDRPRFAHGNDKQPIRNQRLIGSCTLTNVFSTNVTKEQTRKNRQHPLLKNILDPPLVLY